MCVDMDVHVQRERDFEEQVHAVALAVTLEGSCWPAGGPDRAAIAAGAAVRLEQRFFCLEGPQSFFRMGLRLIG